MIKNMECITDVYQRTLGPLSLFKDPVDAKSKQEVFLERPITPINDEIKRAPTVFGKLANYVRRRIKLDDQALFMDIEDQECLVAVLMSEVSYIWPDLRSQPDDPFLTEAQNRELQRRIIVHIVSTCQILFQNYIRKLDVLNKRGVFTSEANIIRLKAQLASDANRFLDVQTIRRHICAEIKCSQKSETCDDASVYSLTFIEIKQPHLEWKPYLSVADLVDASRPRSVSKKKQCTLISEAVPIMMAEMPKLDQEKMRRLADVLPAAGAKASHMEVIQHGQVEEGNSSINDCVRDSSKKTSENESLEKVRLKRSKSLIALMQMDGHSDEWEDGWRTSRPEHLGLWHGECRSKIGQHGSSLKSDCTEDSKQSINDDLKRLMLCENELTSEDDIPPLLLFLSSNSRSERRREELEKQLRKLEEREKAQKEREKTVLAKHLHAQPSYATKKMPGKFTVRTSDVRLSNRNSLSSLTLCKHGTVYNHLSNEIGADTLKKLDSNLFLKEEMTDVFEEIMKTMPSDHLQLDADVHVEPGPVSGTMLTSVSSSILNSRKNHHICNKNLQETLKSGRLSDFQGDLSRTSVDIHGTEEAKRDLLSKSIGSWLTWWKGTVNSDDYMKYLSTQETDYLGVIFHFYNSDDEEEDAEKAKMEKVRMLANEQKLMAIVSQKTEFQPGLWNVNSVLMGGLGQTPTIEPDSSCSPIISSTADKSGEVPMKSSSFIRPKSQLHASKSESSEQKCDTSTVSPDRSFISEAQQRLENVWTKLQMPESQKLDMTVKYSFDVYYQKLRDAINDWEAVTELIMRREAVILQLEKFERLASDPVRLLGRGSCGSKQLSEERHREAYNQKIAGIEVRLKALLDKIEKLYQDIVTYQGRPYRDKMACDRVEMLFWLQEERKNKLLEHDFKSRNLPPLPETLVSLSPITIGDQFTPLEIECMKLSEHCAVTR